MIDSLEERESSAIILEEIQSIDKSNCSIDEDHVLTVYDKIAIKSVNADASQEPAIAIV